MHALSPLRLDLLRILLLTSFLGTLTIRMATAAAYSLVGKRVLVTGSSGGIGRGIALELGGRQGCDVFVHYNERQQGAERTAAEIKAAGGSCAGIVQADFRNVAEIHRLYRELDAIWPEGMDILINNAGIVSKVALEDDSDLSAWHECMAVNLHAPRLLSQLALPRMKLRNGGVIINVSSIHGEKSNEYMAPYAASKSALDSLTRSMAIEYAVHNVRVNAIAPGVVPVERTADAFADQSVTKSWADRIPVRRLGTVEEIAAVTVPLIQNEWVTGSIWQIDGGMMARCNMPDRPRPLPKPDGFA